MYTNSCPWDKKKNTHCNFTDNDQMNKDDRGKINNSIEEKKGLIIYLKNTIIFTMKIFKNK